MSVATAQRMVGHGRPQDREKDDFYPTPPLGTELLLTKERFAGSIWEPACGRGDMSRVLEAAGYEVISTDLVDRGYGEGRQDFLLHWGASLAPNIVTNPPFKLGEEFARHALDLGCDKVALLLRIHFLEGQRRLDLLRRLARVWVFSKRMIGYAWYVWDRAHVGPPILGWVP